MTDPELSIAGENGLTIVSGQSMLFHCNHYNRAHQQYIEDPNYVDSKAIFLRSAAETSYLHLQPFLDDNPDASFEEVLEQGAGIYKLAGFGRLDFSDVTEDGGEVVEPSSHYGEALQLNVGERDSPGEHFDRGFIAGVLLAAGEHTDSAFADGVSITQTESMTLDADRCVFDVEAGGDFTWLEMTTKTQEYETVEPPARTAETGVDEAEIIEAVQGLGLTGNEAGLIPNFGLTLTQGYRDYYDKTSFRFIDAVTEEMGSHEIATELLMETGHLCGFNTFGGVMTSPEWDAVVDPMLETREDWIHGIVAVINALGWGTWRVENLVPDERLEVRVYNPYESVGHLEWFGDADYPVDYVAAGGCAALMNLLYYGDITDDLTLDKETYAELFGSRDGFEAEQTKCVAMGDEYTEIVATR